MLAQLVAALLCAAPATSSAVVETQKDKGFDAVGIPLVSFNSDQGFGVGAVGGGYFYAPGYIPYRHGIALQAFITTFGIQNHWLRYDGPKLIGDARFEARVEYRRELFSPYFGPGNFSAPEFGGNLKDPRFTYDKFSPAAWVRLRGRPVDPKHPLQLYGGYGFRYTRNRGYADSIFARERPLGGDGGPTGQVSFGALWDTRDDESDPTRGGLEEAAFRGSAEITGSAYNFYGITLSERRFFRLGSPRFILAQRFTVDLQYGEVPFFEWPNTGGLNGTEGVGGMSSVRGVPRNRFQGNHKVISNSELRFYVVDFPLLGQTVKVGGLAFFDVGRSWHPGIPSGPWHAWHPGVGGGLRLARRAAVVRVDYGVSTETWRQGLYMTFGHMF